MLGWLEVWTFTLTRLIIELVQNEDFLGTNDPSCVPCKNFSSSYFLDILIWTDAVFHGLSEKRKRIVGQDQFGTYFAQILWKNLFTNWSFGLFPDVRRAHTRQWENCLIYSFVENSFSYRMTPTAAQKELCLLRKVKNTETTQLSCQNHSILLVIVSVDPLSPQARHL